VAGSALAVEDVDEDAQPGLGKSTFSSLAQIARAAGEVLREQPVDLELAQRGEAGIFAPSACAGDSKRDTSRQGSSGPTSPALAAPRDPTPMKPRMSSQSPTTPLSSGLFGRRGVGQPIELRIPADDDSSSTGEMRAIKFTASMQASPVGSVPSGVAPSLRAPSLAAPSTAGARSEQPPSAADEEESSAARSDAPPPSSGARSDADEY